MWAPLSNAGSQALRRFKAMTDPDEGSQMPTPLSWSASTPPRRVSKHKSTGKRSLAMSAALNRRLLPEADLKEDAQISESVNGSRRKRRALIR